MKSCVAGIVAPAVLACLAANPVIAYTFLDSECVSSTVHWSTHSCKSSLCTPVAAAYVDRCSEDNTVVEESATAWGFWMWVREGALKHQLYWNTGSCDSSMSIGDGTNTFDWTLDAFIPGNYAGGIYRSETCAGVGHGHFEDVDMVLCSDCTWSGDALFGAHAQYQACASWGFFREHVASHEVGHAYSLDHDDTIPSIMNETENYARGCNQGSGWHLQPEADAQQGAAYLYGRNTNNIRNASEMIWFLNEADGLDATFISNSNYCGYGVYVQGTDMSYYAAIPSMSIRYVMVPEGQIPNVGSPNWATSSTRSLPANFVGMNQWNAVISAPYYMLTPGVLYRLWAQVDPSNSVVESDEGDNLVPFDVLIQRGLACGG